MTAVNAMTKNEKQVTRPLKVLVPLIQKDLEQGDKAAQSAGMPFYQAAGEKLLEAKPTFKGRIDKFHRWIGGNFDISMTTARKYMELVPGETTNRVRGGADPLAFKSMNAFHRATNNPSYVPNKPRPQPWHDPVKEALNRVNVEAMRQADLNRQQERELERKLALQLIDIGYKALASKLHPDKGGSRDAMSRLNAVRERLKACV